MIVTCEHHSGMGLCPACSREQGRHEEERRHKERNVLRSNEMLLTRAAAVLSEAGEHDLARRIRALVGRP